MARYRKRRIYKRSKGRWSANIQEINNQEIQTAQGSFSATTTLAVNPAQSNAGVSQTYTVKNMEISFTIEGTERLTLAVEGITCYIMYVPQGMNVSENYNLEHPEYILTYKYLGSPNIEYLSSASSTPVTTQNYQPYKIKTRMARRLQTGDSIILFIKGYSVNNQASFKISGLIRWWTKAN